MITEGQYNALRNAIEADALDPGDLKEAAKLLKEFEAGTAPAREQLHRESETGAYLPEPSAPFSLKRPEPPAPKPKAEQALYRSPEYHPPAVVGQTPFGDAISSASNALSAVNNTFFEPSYAEFERDNPQYAHQAGRVPGVPDRKQGYEATVANQPTEDYKAAYKRYSDARYAQEYDDAVKNGRSIIRNADAKTNGWAGTVQKGALEAGHQATAGLLSVPIAGPLLGKGAELLGARPEYLQNLKESAPLGATVGEFAGAGSKYNPANALAEAVVPVRGATAGIRLAQRAGQGAIAGGTTVAGNKLARGETPNLKDTAIGTVAGAGLASALSPLPEGSAALQRGTREALPDLVKAEGPGFGRTSVTRGIKPAGEAPEIIKAGNESGDLTQTPKERFGEVEAKRYGPSNANFLATGRNAGIKAPSDELLDALTQAHEKAVTTGGHQGDISPTSARFLRHHINNFADLELVPSKEVTGKTPVEPVKTGYGYGPNRTAMAANGSPVRQPIYEGEFTSSNVGANGKPLPQATIEGEVVPEPKKLNGWQSETIPETGQTVTRGIPTQRQADEYLLQRQGMKPDALAKMSDQEVERLATRQIQNGIMTRYRIPAYEVEGMTDQEAAATVARIRDADPAYNMRAKGNEVYRETAVAPTPPKKPEGIGEEPTAPVGKAKSAETPPVAAKPAEPEGPTITAEEAKRRGFDIDAILKREGVPPGTDLSGMRFRVKPKPLDAQEVETFLKELRSDENLRKVIDVGGIEKAGFGVRSQFAGDKPYQVPDVPPGPEGWNKFKSEQEARIKGAEGLFNLQGQAGFRLRGLPPIFPVPNGVGARLRLDAALRNLGSHWRGSSGALGSELTDEQRDRLSRRLSPLGRGF